jgi:glycosyltransferase involved in cell wall biosynthesis
MRLLIVTQYFPPEMGAPQARLFELAKRLQGMGHQVTVLTAMPNYPTGKVFDGYRWKLRCVEEIDGIRTIRTCLYPSHSTKILPRLFSYMTFGLSSLVLSRGLGKHDVVLIESPPLFLVPAGVRIARRVGGNPVMMVADIWPECLIKTRKHMNAKAVKAMYWLEKYSYYRCRAVALTNPGARDHIRQRFPEIKDRITVISNGVDTKMFRPEFRSDRIRAELGAGPNDFVVGYCGLHGVAQGLEVVVNAANILRDERGITFVMVGEGPTKDKLMAQARGLDLPNLKFLDRRPKNQMPGLVASFDTSLMPLAVRYPGTMPSKVYEALASGTPPIVAKGCEAEALVVPNQAGLAYEPGDAKELAAAIKELAADRSRWGTLRDNAYRLSARFDRDVIAQRTADVLMAVAEGKPLPEVAW